MRNKQECTVEAIRQKSHYNLVVKIENQTFHPINVKLHHTKIEISDPDELESLTRQYSGLGPEKPEVPTWNALAELPKPIVITLDRTISAEAEERFYSESTYLPLPGRQLKASRSPMKRVREVTSSRYAQYKSKVIQLNNVLKTRMALSALRDPEESFSKNSMKISPREIEALERKVTNYVSSTIKGVEFEHQTKRFFERIKTLMARTPAEDQRDQDVFWASFAGQYRQIEDLAGAFNTFETHSAQAFEPLQRYLNALNEFFKDSGKRLAFDERANQLAFQRLTPDGEPPEEFRNIDKLSSGERQLLILFTFLAFIADTGGLFIVDEPELSLHPKWQSEFLDAFLALKAPKNQLLIATHSPEIVGAHKAACVVLLP